MKTTQSGISTCTFTIAVNRPRQKDGQQIADFIPIVTWRATAENCSRYLAKGRKVAVTGEIRTRNYEAKDGHKVYVTEVLASNVEFLTPRTQDGGSGNGDYYQQPQGGTSPQPDENGFVEVDDDELPF